MIVCGFHRGTLATKAAEPSLLRKEEADLLTARSPANFATEESGYLQPTRESY